LRVLTESLRAGPARIAATEERQFVELTSRLIDQVDDATRAAVRARCDLSGTPAEVLSKLGLKPSRPDRHVAAHPRNSRKPVRAAAAKPMSEAQLRMASNLSMQPKDAAEISDMFFRASGSERALILHNLADTPLRASARIPAARAARAIETLEMAAFAADLENFTLEIGEALILPTRIAAQVSTIPAASPWLARPGRSTCRATVFQRVLLFLKPEFGSSVNHVYRLSRLYDRLGETIRLDHAGRMARLDHGGHPRQISPLLYDDERHRARSRPARPAPRRNYLTPTSYHAGFER